MKTFVSILLKELKIPYDMAFSSCKDVVKNKYPDAQCIKQGVGFVVVVNRKNDTIGVGDTYREAWECSAMAIYNIGGVENYL